MPSYLWLQYLLDRSIYLYLLLISPLLYEEEQKKAITKKYFLLSKVNYLKWTNIYKYLCKPFALAFFSLLSLLLCVLLNRIKKNLLFLPRFFIVAYKTNHQNICVNFAFHRNLAINNRGEREIFSLSFFVLQSIASHLYCIYICIRFLRANFSKIRISRFKLKYFLHVVCINDIAQRNTHKKLNKAD